MPFISFFIPNSIQDSRFSGNAESFNIVNIVDQNNIVGQMSEIYFQANQIILSMNNPDIIFRSTKNITIENYKGEKKLINYSPIIQIINYKENYLVLSNGYFDFGFWNYTMTKIPESFYNSIIINGTIDKMFSNGGEVSIANYSIDYIIIGDEKFTNFKQIVFEMDKNGSIEFSSEISKLSVYPIEVNAHHISDLRIEGKFSKLTLNRGEGTLRIGNHQFDIKAADDLSIEILPYTSKLSVKDTIVNFKGNAIHSLLNNNNIIMTDFYYWLIFKPEIISGSGVLIAAVLATIISFYFPFRQEKIKNKDEKQRILNVLFAEFNTNKKFIEYLKNSIDDMIKNSGEIQVKFENIIFLGFRDDGFNTFRNLGGVQYIDGELYDKIANYYVISYNIHKKFEKIISLKKIEKLMGQNIKDLMQDIESIESLNKQLRNELENEIQKT